jgi:ABC-type transport system substrate-binding protein
MFDGLLTVTPDLRYTPDLAQEVPTVDNGGVVLKDAGMNVSWKLKSGMQWSDGEPINCDDLKATWTWNMDPANAGLVGGTAGWENISGIDGGIGTTCVVHYSTVYEGYLNLFSPVLPAHYLTTVSAKEAPAKLYPLNNPSAGVYSGPYIPKATKARAQITLIPNPKWQTISGHAPWLGSVTWNFSAGPNSVIAAFKTGGYDVAQGLGNDDIPALAGIDPSEEVIHDSRRLQQREPQGQVRDGLSHHHRGHQARDRSPGHRRRASARLRHGEQQLRLAALLVLQGSGRLHGRRSDLGLHAPRERWLEQERRRLPVQGRAAP